MFHAGKTRESNGRTAKGAVLGLALLVPGIVSCAAAGHEDDLEAADALGVEEARSAGVGAAEASAAVDPNRGGEIDPSKDGPFKSTTLKKVGPDAGYTVYLPRELGANGFKHPIIAWMSGGGTTHALYPLLPRLATHGFVVVAADVVPGIGTEVALGKKMLAGLDWTVAENARTGSPLMGKLDTGKLAAMGYSMGSLATFTIAGDPRLTTTVHISGGNFDQNKERVRNLRAPAAFLCGTPKASCSNILSNQCDIAAAQCDTDFAKATSPVFYANFQGGHLGILTPPLSGRIGTLATAWLRFRLLGESERATNFVGRSCTTCTDPKWKVQQRDLDALD